MSASSPLERAKEQVALTDFSDGGEHLLAVTAADLALLLAAAKEVCVLLVDPAIAHRMISRVEIGRILDPVLEAVDGKEG